MVYYDRYWAQIFNELWLRVLLFFLARQINFANAIKLRLYLCLNRTE